MQDELKSGTVVATDDSLSTEIDGETVILQAEEGKYFGLNDVGTFIWEAVQQPRTVEEVYEAVTAEYDVEYERCQSDVDALLSDLLEKDLVQIKPDSST
ncbi:PqqD family protein [Halogeometricum sp. S1BR25-6]|uniref:PqqD family protein n=1 Tax=Halogeometricum salsisoli TaxID=2950536 RepID=A0ABU2GHE9_9EURY|nr:PqqD family protein [Halogeometricum sp. S1BR25-6]MDS0300235.1 PqqD family protein [Halogeometricum sp. S1BR25-6]